MVRVKVCGLQSERDVDACIEAGVDAVGFIFASSPRQVSPAVAERLTRLVPPFVTCVGVFARNEAAQVGEALERCRLDVLQFSGGEDALFCGSFGKPTIMVFHVPADDQGGDTEARPLPSYALKPAWPPPAMDLRTARAIATMADAAADGRFGGAGTAVSSDIAARMRRSSPLPFVLAGGLGPDNVANAIATIQPWAVDVCSGVERDGHKERSLIERFVSAAHGSVLGG